MALEDAYDEHPHWFLTQLKSAAPTTPIKEKTYNYVDHPKHYNDHPSGIECIEVVRHMNFNVGSAMKYLWRAGLKPGEATKQDIEKAIWYLQDELKRLS